MKRSKFSLSHYKLLTGDMGKIIPIGLTEVLPGDTVQQATSMLVRCSPLVAPVMHPVHVRIHHWFVPHRLVWDNWEPFITGGPDGQDTSAFPIRNFSGGVVPGDLADYYGVLPGFTGAVSALPFRGYQLIYNEWYRDQDLIAESPVSKADGADSTTSIFIKNAAWEKDYFTTARPWVTKGGGVSLPIGISAPVVADGTMKYQDGLGIFEARRNTVSGDTGLFESVPLGSPSTPMSYNAGLRADLQQASAVGINELREAFALQRYQEARSRYGSRYTEYLAYLGVRSSDARLQRPEYLGGGKQTIQFSEVLQTGPNDPATGNTIGGLAGHGIGALRSNRYRRFFSEHGYIHSFVIVLPKTIYTQALPRTLNRRIKEDFWQKELQHIGQQEVLNKEVYAMHTDPDGTFGYQDRYDEYRRSESGVCGEFRDTLDYWHLGRVFAGNPALNESFISSDPTKRVFAEQTQHSLWMMANHSIQARRMVARSGTSFIV